MTLFRSGQYKGASGKILDGKIECSVLTDTDIETLAEWIAKRAGPFSAVEGVPTGGLRLAAALQQYKGPIGPLLLVDDVLTTGGSIEKQRAGRPAVGWVIFTRGFLPAWCHALFYMTLE